MNYDKPITTIGIGAEIGIINNLKLNEIIVKICQNNEWASFIYDIPEKEEGWETINKIKIPEEILMNSCILRAEGMRFFNGYRKHNDKSSISNEFEIGLKLIIASHRIENLFFSTNYCIETFVAKAFDGTAWEWPTIIKKIADIVKNPSNRIYQFSSIDDYVICMVENACASLQYAESLYDSKKKNYEKDKKEYENKMLETIETLTYGIIPSIKILIAAYNLIAEFGLKNNKYASSLETLKTKVAEFLK